MTAAPDLPPRPVAHLARRRSCRRGRYHRIVQAVLAAAGVVGALATTAAAAEPNAADRAIAERLYDQGRKQLTEGNTAAACESFGESMRLDPGTGILLNLASCHETQGRLATAWVEFREALTASRRRRSGVT